MQIAETLCRKLVDMTIFWQEFRTSQSVVESTSDNRVYQTDRMVFKFSEDVQSLKYEFYCCQKLLREDCFAWAHAFIDTEEGAVLVTQRLPGTTDIDTYWDRMDQEAQQNFVQECVQALCVVHTIDTEGIYKGCPWKQEITDVYDKILANPHIDKTYHNKVSLIRNDRLFLHDKIPVGWVALHNDFWYKNLLHVQWKFSWLVDFEEGFLAPKRIEGARLHQQLWYARQGGNQQEIQLMQMIVDYAEKHSPSLFDSSMSSYVHTYSWLKSLSQRDLPWYDRQEKELFFQEFLN